MRPTRRVALLLALFCLSGCGMQTARDSVTIAQVLSLTGGDKTPAEHAKNGARLAVDLAAKREQSASAKKVVLLHVDDRGDEELAQAEAVRLITLNKAAALLGGPGPADSTQLARTAQGYGVPVVLTADLPELPTGEAVFCLNAAPATRGAALARYAAHELSCVRVIAIVDPTDAPGVALAAGFVAEWRKSQDKKASVEEWPYPEEPAGGEWTRRVSAAKSDAVLLATTAQKALQLRSRLALAGLKTVFLYGGEEVEADALAESGSELPTIYLATAFTSRDKLAPDGEAFAREYEAKFRERPGLAAALAYDGVRLLIDALDRAKSTAPTAIKDELLAVREFPGVTGPISLADRRPRRKIFVVAIKGSEQKVVRTFGPGLE